jgi:hypothetical protein
MTPKRIAAWFLGMVLLSVHHAAAQETTSVAGDNWFLPEWVQPAHNSGFYGYPDDLPGDLIPEAVALNLTWAQVNPADDVYDWSLLREGLRIARENNVGIFLRLFASDQIHVPPWIQSKYPDLQPMPYVSGSAELSAYGDVITGSSPGLFYPIWDAGFDAEMRELLADFGREGFAADPALLMMYAPAAWRWNEWEGHFIPELVAAGWTPERFLDWHNAHLEVWAAAFGEHVYKLVYTGHPYLDDADYNTEWAAVLNDLDTGANRMTDYAVALGMSVRTGALEEFNRYNVMPSWGVSALTLEDGLHLRIDATHPLRRDPLRILATENEAWGNAPMTGALGEFYGVGYVVRMNMLKTLQLQMNWVNVSQDTYNTAPDLMRYVRLSLGQTAQTSADAWVQLREWYDATRPLAGLETPERLEDLPRMRNWERWLYQQDQDPDGRSVAVEPVASPLWLNLDPRVDPYTVSEARRTDHANGQDYLYFMLDDEFLSGSSENVQILVTYLDNTNATWWIEYDAGEASPYQSSATHTNLNDGQWRTVTFTLEDADFGNRQHGGMDFRLYNGGSTDLTVTFVRVLRLSAPQ